MKSQVAARQTVCRPSFRKEVSSAAIPSAAEAAIIPGKVRRPEGRPFQTKTLSEVCLMTAASDQALTAIIIRADF
jgi:hypothetical protein